MQDRLAEALKAHNVDYADIRIEDKTSSQVAFRGQELDQIGSSRTVGGIVRALYKGGWGYATFNDLEKHALNLSQETQRQIREASKKFMIIYKTLTPIVYTSVKDSGVMLTMRYLCHVKQRRGTEQTIWEAVLEKFAEHANIDFAYPTTRFYNNKIESKEAKTE